jgi:hypothetical protein
MVIQIKAIGRPGLYELKQHKPWSDEELSKLLGRREKAKFRSLQNPIQINGDNMNNIRREVSRTFRTIRREYLKNKINELETNSKNRDGYLLVSCAVYLVEVYRCFRGAYCFCHQGNE